MRLLCHRRTSTFLSAHNNGAGESFFDFPIFLRVAFRSAKVRFSGFRIQKNTLSRSERQLSGTLTVRRSPEIPDAHRRILRDYVEIVTLAPSSNRLYSHSVLRPSLWILRFRRGDRTRPYHPIVPGIAPRRTFDVKKVTTRFNAVPRRWHADAPRLFATYPVIPNAR